MTEVEILQLPAGTKIKVTTSVRFARFLNKEGTLVFQDKDNDTPHEHTFGILYADGVSCFIFVAESYELC